MPNGLRLRPSVLAAREKLAAGREKLRTQHDSGSPGIQVCTRLTDLLDTVLLDLYHEALADLGGHIEPLIALAPNGGYGRRDVAPYSDVDLMLLHKPGHEREITPFVRRLTQDIVDSGLQLGYSLRTPSQACSMAINDATIFTTLVESRYLGGSVQLFSKFMRRFRKVTLRRSPALIARIMDSRSEERRQHGDTVYLLKPNVKRSRGGLRDLQVVRWIGFARYGEAEPESLTLAGVLEERDRLQLRNAREFLLRLRNEMHFHAGKSQDLLDRNEQVRIAELMGYQGDESTLPVEQFMRTYIEHTSHVRYSAAHFVATARARNDLASLFGKVFSRRVDGDFRIGPRHIRATRSGIEKVRTDVAEVLRLMDLANRTQRRIDHATWQAIRESMMNRPITELSDTTAEYFLSLLGQPGRLGALLRRLHELRVLEQIIPPMSHARHRMQFNEYHRYTIDEHSIRAIERATEFAERDDSLGRAYRKVKKQWLLHLALLLHDLGKGFAEDHSVVGERLAEETARSLRLGDRDTEILRFLVRQHLVMSHLAQWRDIEDDDVVLQFAADVGSAEVLQMMYVLTCADLAAVGPGVLNNWKLDLLTRLYKRTRTQLTGGAALEEEDRTMSDRRDRVLELVRDEPEQAWWQRQSAALPRSYLVGFEASELVQQLTQLHDLSRDGAVAWGRHFPDRKATEYTIGTYEHTTPGIFHKLTGALTSSGLEILSAEIHTLADELVLDRFYVRDTQHAGAPPSARMDDVCSVLVGALTDPDGSPPTFQRTWLANDRADIPDTGRLPTRVRIDNSTSEHYTILDVFAHDHTGLLYAISRKLFDLGLSVHGAKIGTYFDQVVDVFYVRDAQGKLTQEQRIAEVRQQLLEAIETIDTANA